MAVKRLTNLRPQYFDSNGLLASGYRLFFYASGSSTKQNTYNSSLGNVANSNPITLNALGEPAVEIWLTTGLSYKVGLAIPGSDDPPASFVWTEDVVAGVNDATLTIDQWIAGPTPTYIGATSFSLVGDQTSTFSVGRRVKTTNTSGTIYSSISASSFGAGITTVTVVNDSGVLDSGLSAVSYGIISATNSSQPYTTDTYTATLTGVSGTVTATIRYTKTVGGDVTIDFPGTSGTSNATSKTLTGMPAVIRPARSKLFPILVSDNGGATVWGYGTLASDGTITITATAAGGGWTNSGTATINAFELSYTQA